MRLSGSVRPGEHPVAWERRPHTMEAASPARSVIEIASGLDGRVQETSAVGVFLESQCAIS